MPRELVDTITVGLSSQEAGELLEKFGPNSLPEKKPPSDFSIFLSQLKSPLVYVLLVAAIVTSFLGEFADTIIIGLAVLLNTVLGFFQERRAGRALEALKKLLRPTAEVVRDGKIVVVDAESIVPGDIVRLSQGDKMPADGRIIEASRFFVSEALLTGESSPIGKEANNEVFMGTIVTGGHARMEVTKTGEETEMGKIAESILEDGVETPLKKKLKKFSNHLSILVLGLTVIVFVVGVLTGGSILDMFTTAVALAVSAIPEGLLVGLTVVLAIGMQRILARKGLVRNLVSAETLGSVTTICIDKTGTLTLGKMQVVDISGDEQGIAQHILLSNNIDTPVVVSAWEWANKVIHKSDLEKIKKFTAVDEIPFTSESKVFMSLNHWKDDEKIYFVTGAPELLLKNSKLKPAEKKKVMEDIEKLSSEGKRLLGFARKRAHKSAERIKESEVLKDMEWSGLLALNDPIRPDVSDALKKTMKAGIKIMVITGDYANTALSVLKTLGMTVDKKEVVVGEDLDKMSQTDLEKHIFSGEANEVRLFARTRPEQKLKIVETLKHRGEVVAMMGDGVNDAPALSRADIGIVVGDATDVAKESADLVLLDSSFATIVAAIEEGRGIFDNIRKIILYLMSDAFIEILLILTALLAGLPAPLAAVQILWINLASDGFPHLALTVDPKSSGVMSRGPRSSKEPLLARWMIKLISIVSFVGWMFALGVYIYAFRATGDEVFARSVTFAVVGVNSLIYVFSIRTLKEPFWRENLFGNKWLLLAVLVGFMIQVFPFTSAPIREFFGVVPLGIYWVAAIFGAGLLFFTIEAAKWAAGKLSYAHNK